MAGLDDDDEQLDFRTELQIVDEQAQAATRSRPNTITLITTSTPTTTTTTPPFSTAQPTAGQALVTAASSSSSRRPETTFVTYTTTTLWPDTTHTPLPDTSDADSSDGGGLSTGQLAAAIAVPLAVTALLALFALLVLRRRRRSRRAHAHPDSSSGSGSGRGNGRGRGRGKAGGRYKCSAGSLRAKWGSLASCASSQFEKRPEVSSAHHHNHTSMKSLTTSLQSPSPRDEEPPPYAFDTPAAPAPPLAPATARFSPIRPPNDILSVVRISPATVDPSVPIFPDLPTPNPSFLHHGRPGSARSINSDAYSDNASIHSARAARLSMGGPTLIIPGARVNTNRA